MNRYNYLSDSSFLSKIDRLINKEQIIKIVTLNANEEELQEIQGQIISGNLNLNGKSSVRRTGNLTFLPEDQAKSMQEIKMLISKNKKIKIEIGIKNTTNEYLDCSFIWFPLGLFVVTDVSFSYDNQGVKISLQLKDKMCLLNGDCGGVIPAAVNFSKYDTIIDNSTVTLDVPIYQIIYELVNHFGEEQLSKIIIRDVDLISKRVVKWIGDETLYIIKYPSGYFATTDSGLIGSKNQYQSYNKGEDIGYEYVEFTYPGEEGLNINAGETVCQVLDKIKNLLGNYEYFYDIDGNFIFQEIKNYLNTSRATVELNSLENEDYLIFPNKTKNPYSFEDEVLISSYSNAPQINLIKNDFIIWGSRKTDAGKELPIRYHLALDEKPKIGKEYEVIFYTDTDGLKKIRMGIEYPNADSLPIPGEQGIYYLVGDFIYIWIPSLISSEQGHYEWFKTNQKIQKITTKDWRTELYLQGVESQPLGTSSNYYYTELFNEWPKLYNIQKGEYIATNGTDIDYYLDFIDSSAPEIAEISIPNIGRRTEVINNDKVNCIFEPEIPNMWIVSKNSKLTEEEVRLKGENYVVLDEELFDSKISTGGGYNSAYQAIRQLLHSYLNYSQTVSINTIPIYHLEPNTIIKLNNEESDICGEYVINSITIPLDTSGNMSISCSKVIERI